MPVCVYIRWDVPPGAQLFVHQLLHIKYVRREHFTGIQ